MTQPQSHRPFISMFTARACAPLLFAALAFAPVAALAQAPIEQQMTPEQFKAAGLDQLTPEQLANLNAWLDNTLDSETQKAATQAKTEAKQEAREEAKNRRFGNFGIKEPIVANLVGEFHGFARGRQYTLDNGQVWEQTNNAELPGVHLTNPKVRIKPSVVGEAAYLTVGDIYVSATVKRIK